VSPDTQPQHEPHRECEQRQRCQAVKERSQLDPPEIETLLRSEASSVTQTDEGRGDQLPLRCRSRFPSRDR